MAASLRWFVALCLALAAFAPAVAPAAGNEPQPSLAEDRDFRAGRAAIDAGDWRRAITALNRAASRYRDDASVFNWLGYAHRRAGELDAAFRHYRTALRLDPDHRGAHEYIGEAYLMQKDIAAAERHLKELERVCRGTGCEEYRELAGKISAAKDGRQ